MSRSTLHRSLALLALAALSCDGHSRSAHDTTEGLITAIDQRDAPAAIALQVSSAQLARLVTCATPTKAPWLTADARAATLEARRAEYAGATSATSVKLGPLFEDYDRPKQWHSYRAGDVIYADCHAKVPFSTENYRIVLVISEGSREPKRSTKPIELWKIDGAYYVWDDPMDTEGWR